LRNLALIGHRFRYWFVYNAKFKRAIVGIIARKTELMGKANLFVFRPVNSLTVDAAVEGILAPTAALQL
jgi:hypothetical protein